jgi:ABC-2 type transport system permease protein
MGQSPIFSTKNKNKNLTMSKLWLIVQREYLTRVRTKAFILGTLLAPLGLVIYTLVIVGLTKYQGSEESKIAIFDESHIIKSIPDEKGIRYIPSGEKTLEMLKMEAKEKKIDGVLRIPALTTLQTKDITTFYYSDEKLAPEKSDKIERRIASKIREFKIDSLHLNRQSLEGLETKVSIDPESITKKDVEQSKYTAGVGIALGGFMAFIMFFMVLMYGNMVMRSVMEEKTNRIVEVMMSTVRPFELMLGKILGTGAVGLTQVVAWLVLSTGVSFVMSLFLGENMQQMQMNSQIKGQIDPELAQDMMGKMMTEMSQQNWPLLLTAFVIFFLGGYFIYASMFAAIGSAMSDDMADGQALVLPVTIPLVIAFYIVMMAGIRNPDSGLMVFASLFPLFSPIVMPFRMAFNPPWWQIALSLSLVVLSAIFFVWLAGRIYRVGILLYGKKVTFKEIGKWLFYKG